MSAVEKFPILLSDAEEESSAVAPCFSHEGINVRICILRLVAAAAHLHLPPAVPRNPLCLPSPTSALRAYSERNAE